MRPRKILRCVSIIIIYEKKTMPTKKNYTIHFFIFYENIGFDKNNNFSRTDFCVKFKKMKETVKFGVFRSGTSMKKPDLMFFVMIDWVLVEIWFSVGVFIGVVLLATE